MRFCIKSSYHINKKDAPLRASFLVYREVRILNIVKIYIDLRCSRVCLAGKY